MKPKIVITFTLEGMAPPAISADTEQDQAAAEELLERIRPCLDVADAILKKGDPGSRG